MRTLLLGVTAAAVALLAGRPALANGRFPASNQIVFSPTKENIIVGRTTYAILPSNDNGKSWGYLCENALALPATTYQDPELGLTYNNSLVAGLYYPSLGLDVSTDLGCNWNCLGGALANQQIADIVVRPDSVPGDAGSDAGSDAGAGSTSHQVLALTNTFSTDVDAGTYSQVFQSNDDGAHWAALGSVLPSDVVVDTIDVAATDSSRIYVSGTRQYGTARTASLFVSMDNGTTWVEHQVPKFNQSIACLDMPAMQCPSEDSLFIAGVDPTDANRVYLRSNGLTASPTPGFSRLYVTPDGGQTFTVPPTASFVLPVVQSTDFTVIGEMLGFALSPDGSKVFVGTRETGLWSASSTDLMFTNVNSKIHVQCLASRQASTGPELWACSDEISGFVIGRSTDDGMTFDALMPTITSMSGPIACSPNGGAEACLTDANASACSCSTYQQICTGYEPSACFGCGMDGPQTDAGSTASDGGDGGSAVVDKVAPRNASCGCSVVGGGGAAGFFAGCAILAMALRRRRTR
ncbi:MAG: WD40/YVTN/BNR-like repeat-containing protein [Polyangiaceae bacterium]